MKKEMPELPIEIIEIICKLSQDMYQRDLMVESLLQIFKGFITKYHTAYDYDEPVYLDDEKEFAVSLLYTKKISMYLCYTGLEINTGTYRYILKHTSYDTNDYPHKNIMFEEWFSKNYHALTNLKSVVYQSIFNGDQEFSWFKAPPNLESLRLCTLVKLDPKEIKLTKLSIDMFIVWDETIRFPSVTHLEIFSLYKPDQHLVFIIKNMFPNLKILTVLNCDTNIEMYLGDTISYNTKKIY